MLIRHYLAWASVVACGALGARALVDRPEPPRVVTVTAPPTVIAVAAPPPVVVPPPTVVVVSVPPPAPPPAPPGVHIGCGDVATIGMPIASAAVKPSAEQLIDASVSREGCTIAARTKHTLFVSWDGGQTFTRSEVPDIDEMVAVAGRVALLMHDGSLATVLPGKPVSYGTSNKLAYHLRASGPWTALVAETFAAVTDDNGGSWRYIEPPKDATIDGLVGDRLIAHGLRATSEPDGEHLVEYIATTYTNDLRHPGWKHAAATHVGTPADEEDRYALTGDEFWGCGSSEKLVETASGTSVLGGLRPENSPIEVHTAHGVTYANASNQLFRLDGARATQISGDQGIPGSLAGVDAAGTPIIRADYQLLRWSKTGGWRVLLDATP